MKEKNKDNAAVGSLVRDALARFGMQQTELATIIGITPPSLNMMLSGVSNLPLRRFYQIAGILNFTQDEIDKAKEIYRNRLMLSPEQAEQFFVNPSDLNNKQGVSTMGEVRIFNFNGAEVRTQVINNQPMFCLADVCKVLDIGNPSQLKTRLNQNGVTTNEVGVVTGKKADGSDAVQTVKATFITEQNLYKVIFQSRKPEAEQFTDWVTGEVLPAIRKTGGYMVSRADDTPEMIMARALKVADETIRRRERELAEAKQEISVKTEALAVAAPKAAFVDNFCVSQGTILVRDFAKHIAQALELKGFGEKVMFQYLKDNDYLNLNRYPTQRSTDMGLFKVSEGIHQFSDGSTGLHHCSRITCKGQTYFYNKLKEKYETEGRWW